MARKLEKSLIMTTAAIGLLSCGGGSSNSSSIAPPPVAVTPPPQAQAPMINVVVASPAAEEGQLITLDASQTTDPDSNDADLTFTWTQLNGTTAEILSPGEAVTDVLLPEINAGETAQFQLKASDGQNESSETVDVEYRNIFQSPRSSILAPINLVSTQDIAADSRVIGDGQFLSSPAATPPNGTNQISRFNLFGTNANDSLTTELENILISDTSDDLTMVESGLGIFTLTSIDEANNTASLFAGDSFAPDPTEFIGNFPTESPCAIDNTGDGNFVNETVASGGNKAVINIIGQRDSGFEILAPIFTLDPPEITDVVTLQSVGTDESYCFVDFSDDITSGQSLVDNNAFSSPLAGVIIAVDYNNQTIDLFVDNTVSTTRGQEFIVGTTENPQYERVLSEPLLPSGETGLDIIDVHRGPLGSNLYVVLMSDGNHIGDHRAVIFTLEPQMSPATNEERLGFTRADLSWPRGIPQNATFASIRSQVSLNRIITLVVNSSSSPEAIVFQREEGLVADGFQGPSFFELGLDVESIKLEPFTSPNLGTETARLLVHIPDRNLLELRED